MHSTNSDVRGGSAEIKYQIKINKFSILPWGSERRVTGKNSAFIDILNHEAVFYVSETEWNANVNLSVYR